MIESFRYKGSVKNYDSLPTESVDVGDVYDIKNSPSRYVWTGREWDRL